MPLPLSDGELNILRELERIAESCDEPVEYPDCPCCRGHYDARLIAAATDLLAACKRARDAVAGIDGCGALEADLDGVIARAEGGTR